MGRFPEPRKAGSKDSPWEQDGDNGWKGINMIQDPGNVPAGYLIRAENKRMRDGSASTRPGTTFPSDFNPSEPIGTFTNKIVGSGMFSNPNGDEVMLVATFDADYVWALQFGKDPVKIFLSGGERTGNNTTLTIVNFVQGFERCLLLRFPFDTPLVWDGVNGNTFDPITATDPTRIIPTAVVFGQPFQNRILYYIPSIPSLPWRDQFIASDVLDYTMYDSTLYTFRVNAGEADIITSIQPFFKGSVIVFMRDSIHMVENFTIDPFQTSQRMLNSRIGSVSLHMPLMDGNDIIFLSRTGSGLYRISEVIQDEVSALPRPISWPIQPIMDRINWEQAALWACSEGLGDYAYFLLPLDGVTGGSNAIVVYNTVTREWESAPDTWDDPGMRLNNLHVCLYNNERRLFGLDYNAARIYLLYDGIEDDINNDIKPVHDRIATRGYVVGDPGAFKRYHRVQVAVRTYDPNAVVRSVMDGFNEVRDLATITKSREKFYTHGKPDLILGDDVDAPFREDYSVTEDNSAVEDFENLPTGPLAFLPGTPLTFTGKKQQTLERYQVRQNGRWCSIEIENTQGQLDVLGVAVDATVIEEGMRTLA